MGGAAGHMAHLHENIWLTIGEIKSFLTQVASADLSPMEKVDGHECIVVFSKPIKQSSYWAKKIFVDKNLFQIRKIEFFSKESILEKTLHIKELVNKGGYWFPSILEMRKSNDNHTIMRVEGFKPDVELDDEIFTKSFLSSQN